VISPGQPFGGWRWSGLGKENGVFSVDAFSESRVIHRSAGGVSAVLSGGASLHRQG
jgi:acyl-CoA reductase-like NAD-dependent aldehyde dehydrogenase